LPTQKYFFMACDPYGVHTPGNRLCREKIA